MTDPTKRPTPANTKTVLVFEGDEFVMTHPCECCGEEIETGLWCAQCKEDNSQFGVGA